METTLIIVASIFVWLFISAIVGSFGTSRSIGFAGAFFASLFLSPILAMLFVLASDKTGDGKMTAGNKALFVVPMIICILIPFGIIAEENHWEHKYQVRNANEQITFLKQLTQESFVGGTYTENEYYNWIYIPTYL